MSLGKWLPWPIGLAHSLSRYQREMLIEHCLGPQLFIANNPRSLTAMTLMKRGLLIGDVDLKPRETYLTALGKQVVCIILGEYADALDKVGPDYEKKLASMHRRRKVRRPDRSDIAEEPSPPISPER